MKTAIDYLLSSLPERYRNAMLNTCQEEIKQAKEKEKEHMVGFHRWMLRTDTADNAEAYFHYTDEDMAMEYFNDFGPGWRDISKPLKAVPSLSDEEIMEMNQKEYERDLEVDTQDPAICNYSGLRPIEGYKEENIDKELNKIVDTEEERNDKIDRLIIDAYRRGWLAGYDEGLYDKEVK